MRERLWDQARGVGIMLVVYGHVLRGLIDAKLVSVTSPLFFSDFFIYTFHMPLFFLLAGMNAQRSMAKGGFLKSKLLTIVYPYFLWSLLQGSVQLMLSGVTNHTMGLDDLLSILWRPTSQFWFLYAIFICQVMAWITRGDAVRIGVFALAAYPIGVYLAPTGGIYARSLIFFLFFALGGFLQPYLKAMVVRMASVEGVGCTLVGLIISVFAAYKMGTYTAPTALCSAFLGIALVLQIAHLAPGRWARALELLGLASMPIYLTHVLATAGMRVVLLKLHVTEVWLHLAAGMVAGLVFPLIAFYCVHLLGREQWLGFSSGAPVFEPVKKLVPRLRERFL